MYDRILIPTDGSEHADRGVDHGLDLAETHDAEVDVLYVVDETIYGTTPAISGYEAFLEKVEEEGQRIVDRAVDRAQDRGLEAVGDVRRGRPDEEILKYADDHDVDVVVMGRRGMANVEPPRLGSVTESVVGRAEVPVVPV